MRLSSLRPYNESDMGEEVRDADEGIPNNAEDDDAVVGVLIVGESGLCEDMSSDVEGADDGERNDENSEIPKFVPNEVRRDEDQSPSSLGGVDNDRRGGAIGARVTGEVGESMPELLGSPAEWEDGVPRSDESSEKTERWSLGGGWMLTSVGTSRGGRCGSAASIIGSETDSDECEAAELDVPAFDAIVSIANGGALRGICIKLVGRGGGGVSTRFNVSFRIRIDPNSLGKSEVKVDFWEELGEYGRWLAEDVGLTDRGSVGADRALTLVGIPVE